MIHTRSATFDDIPWILGEMKKFAVFLGTKLSLFPDDEYAEQTLRQIIDTQVVCIAESTIQNMHDGTQVGFLIGILGPHFFNPAITVLTEMFWWVTPEWRGSRAGALLFHEFMSIGREKKVDFMVMTLEAASPVNPEALERRGFKLYERSYVMEVK